MTENLFGWIDDGKLTVDDVIAALNYAVEIGKVPSDESLALLDQIVDDLIIGDEWRVPGQ